MTAAAPLSHDEYRARSRMPVLDGLRAVSILLVFTAHPAYQHVWPAFHGPSGVTLFFVLSGFLITTLLLREEASHGGVSLRAFFVRRLFRIYPLYLLVFALYCVLILGLGMQPERQSAFVENVPSYLLGFPEHAIFMNDTHVEVPFNMAWSIGIEEKFYLLWPLVAFGLLVRLRRARVWFLTVGVLGVTVVAHTWRHGDVVAPYANIAFGCLAALLLFAPRTYARLAWLGRTPSLLAVATVTVALQFGTRDVLVGHRFYELYGAVVALLLVSVVTTTSGLVGWMASRPMRYLAELSFSLYLIHNFGINFAEMLLPSDHGFAGSMLSTGVGLTGSVLVCHAIHRWFEEPVRRYGSRRAGAIRARSGRIAVLTVQAPLVLDTTAVDTRVVSERQG